MKQALVFICSACGADHAKWAGRCRVCGSWNTLEETKIVKTRTAVRKTANPQTLVSVNSSSHPRLVTGLDEVDLLFGGGLVQGSVYLLTGEPGTGKSTMLLELSRNLPGKILYIAGEETEFQIKERFDRLGIKNDRLFITRETCAESLIELVNRENFNILFIDSIQMLSSSAFENTPGSVVQVRTCACLLINVCKEKNITCIFTGHITKDGTTAGPKIIEHAVDGTVYMYPEAIDSTSRQYRVLKIVKNRFGPSDRIALLEMTQSGFTAADIENRFIDSSRASPGIVLFPHLVAGRIIFSGIECLCARKNGPVPRRTAEGISFPRLCRIIAIIEARLNLDFSEYDVYITVTRGIKTQDVAMDLSIAACLYSALRSVSIPPHFLFLGETSLSGAVKPAFEYIERQAEIKKFGNFIFCGIFESGQNIESIAQLSAFLQNL